MTRDDIIKLAKEAGFDALLPSEEILGRGRIYTGSDDEISDELERFANLVAAAERDKVAQWIMARGYSTGHGDTVADLLQECNWQVREEERELCAQLCEQIADAPSNIVLGVALDCAKAIRARGEK